VFYETDTVPVKDAPGAECVAVKDGKIIHMRIIFYRLPFEEAAVAPPAMAYGALVELAGFGCPLTALQKYLLRRGGQAGTAAGSSRTT
jgi:hypothetical protein